MMALIFCLWTLLIVGGGTDKEPHEIAVKAPISLSLKIKDAAASKDEAVLRRNHAVSYFKPDSILQTEQQCPEGLLIIAVAITEGISQKLIAHSA